MPSSLKSIVWTAAACIVVAMAVAQAPPAPPAVDAPNARKAGEKEIVWLADETEMVLVPEGKALVPEFDEKKPKREMTLPAFYIDKYEVTNARFVKFMNAVPDADEKLLKGYLEYDDIVRQDGRWQAKPGRENFPAMVTFEGAVAFCKWAGKNLPDWPQFMRAACGDDGRKYPWGNEWDPARCVCRGSVKPNQNYRPLPVGSRPTGVSPFGAHDMAGNMQEWVRVPDDFRPRAHDGKFEVPDRVLAGSGYEGDSGGDVGECFGSLDRASHMADCSVCSYGEGFRCVVPADRVRSEAAKVAK